MPAEHVTPPVGLGRISLEVDEFYDYQTKVPGSRAKPLSPVRLLVGLS